MLGKPPLTQEEIDDIFRKLEPRLKTGLSINKACLEAKVPKSSVYDLIKENEQFAERVEAAKNYHTVLIADIVTKELELAAKMAGSMQLTSDQIKLILWVALHSTNTREEYEKREVEVKKEITLETDEEFKRRILAILQVDNPDNLIPQQLPDSN